MHFIIGTAGHVDHGKTTLIRALTGIETDRLREEKERGLSIVPGFAHLRLPDGRTVGIVDVPGHERFLKNMLVGTAGVDVALLVIAADEGVMPQTMEHLRVLELLRIKRGVVALTKCDMVDEEWLALVRADVQARLSDTFLAEAPLVEVSATRAEGLDQLKDALARACDAVEKTHASLQSRPFRLSIDRAFTVAGFGTVVTGSAADGAVAVGETVDVWPPDWSQALAGRLRGIEVHGEAAPRAERGQRTALNLAGIDLGEAARGGTVAATGSMAAASVADAWLQAIVDAPRAIKDGSPLRLHLGAAEVTVRVLLYGGSRLQPGEKGYARLRLEHPLVAARGDRFVVREVATERIVGGGLMLDAPVHLSRTAARAYLPLLHDALEAGDEIALAEILLRRQGMAGYNETQLRFELRRLDVSDILSRLRERGVLREGADIWLHRDVASELRSKITTALREFHRREPLQPAMPREALRAALPGVLPMAVFDALLNDMAAEEEIATSSTGVRRAEHRVTLSEEEELLRERLELLADEAAWQPPTVDELVAQAGNEPAARKLCFALMKSGTLVRIGDFVLSSRRITQGAEILRAHLMKHRTLTVGEARELLNTTRKWVVPLLEYYDKAGLTRREGEARVLR